MKVGKGVQYDDGRRLRRSSGWWNTGKGVNCDTCFIANSKEDSFVLIIIIPNQYANRNNYYYYGLLLLLLRHKPLPSSHMTLSCSPITPRMEVRGNPFKILLLLFIGTLIFNQTGEPIRFSFAANAELWQCPFFISHAAWWNITMGDLDEKDIKSRNLCSMLICHNIHNVWVLMKWISLHYSYFFHFSQQRIHFICSSWRLYQPITCSARQRSRRRRRI